MINFVRAISVLSLGLILLATPGLLNSDPPLTKPRQLTISTESIKEILQSGGMVSYADTVRVCTGNDIGSANASVYSGGNHIGTCTPGSPVPLCPSGATNCPHPANSQCVKWVCMGSYMLPPDPRSSTNESAVIDWSRDFVFNIPDSVYLFLLEQEYASYATLGKKQGSDYLINLPAKPTIDYPSVHKRFFCESGDAIGSSFIECPKVVDKLGRNKSYYAIQNR